MMGYSASNFQHSIGTYDSHDIMGAILGYSVGESVAGGFTGCCSLGSFLVVVACTASMA